MVGLWEHFVVVFGDVNTFLGAGGDTFKFAAIQIHLFIWFNAVVEALLLHLEQKLEWLPVVLEAKFFSVHFNNYIVISNQ